MVNPAPVSIASLYCTFPKPFCVPFNTVQLVPLAAAFPPIARIDAFACAVVNVPVWFAVDATDATPEFVTVTAVVVLTAAVAAEAAYATPPPTTSSAVWYTSDIKVVTSSGAIAVAPPTAKAVIPAITQRFLDLYIFLCVCGCTRASSANFC